MVVVGRGGAKEVASVWSVLVGTKGPMGGAVRGGAVAAGEGRGGTLVPCPIGDTPPPSGSSP